MSENDHNTDSDAHVENETNVKENLRKNYEEEQKKLREALADIKSRIHNFEKLAKKDFDAIEGDLQNYVADLENEIKQKPLKSIGIAAGVGLFVGLLISRH